MKELPPLWEHRAAFIMQAATDWCNAHIARSLDAIDQYRMLEDAVVAVCKEAADGWKKTGVSHEV